MKRIIATLTTIAIILSCVITSTAYNSTEAEQAVNETVIFENGTVEATIVIKQNCSESDSFAANKLKEYLSKVINAEVPIITDDNTAETPNEIIIGTTNRYVPDFDGIDENGYFIRTASDRVMINGKGIRGLLHGVYAFLEKCCGIKWYERDIISIPTLDRLAVQSDLDLTYNPYFEYTNVDTINPRDIEYSVANGLTGEPYRVIPAIQGGSVAYISGFCHTLATQFCSPSKYFEEHPEYFALHDGKRTEKQLCLTNPDVLRLVTDQVIDILRTRHDPNAPLQIISLTQNDNRDYCECDACKKLDDENGSHAGTMITFANAVAKTVKDLGYDNVAIDTFAYQYTRKAPTKVVPLDNVIVRICSIECCFGHTLDDPNCSENVDFMNDLANWGKICERIYIWDYVNNYAQTCCIFPDFGVLQKNVQTFYENNVRGVYEEGNYYIDGCDTEFGELRSYLLSKLMQDPYCDYYAEMDGYLQAVYGNGWKNIREFIDIMTEHAVTKQKHLSIYQASEKTLYKMTTKDIINCDRLWKNAKEETAKAGTQESAQQLSRLKRSEICWRYWKSNNYRGEFSLFRPLKRMVAGQELYEDMIKNGVRVLSEGSSSFSNVEFLHYFLPARLWRTENESALSETLNPISIKLYDLIKKYF